MTTPSDHLKNLSKTSGTPYSLLCQHYAMERFLYRLGLSIHAVLRHYGNHPHLAGTCHGNK